MITIGFGNNEITCKYYKNQQMAYLRAVADAHGEGKHDDAIFYTKESVKFAYKFEKQCVGIVSDSEIKNAIAYREIMEARLKQWNKN
jgi:predicted nucleotidyltransferase